MIFETLCECSALVGIAPDDTVAVLLLGKETGRKNAQKAQKALLCFLCPFVAILHRQYWRSFVTSRRRSSTDGRTSSSSDTAEATNESLAPSRRTGASR